MAVIVGPMPPFDASAVVLVIIAVFFAGMGVYALVAPARLIAPFGVELPSVTARSEVRAVYGGFGVAIAAVLVVALTHGDLRPGIAVTVSTALAGMALGRLTSLLDGSSPLYPNWFYCGVEATGATVLYLGAGTAPHP